MVRETLMAQALGQATFHPVPTVELASAEASAGGLPIWCPGSVREIPIFDIMVLGL